MAENDMFFSGRGVYVLINYSPLTTIQCDITTKVVLVFNSFKMNLTSFTLSNSRVGIKIFYMQCLIN